MDALNRLRRPSFSPFGSSVAKANEPLIVVEESGLQEEDEHDISPELQNKHMHQQQSQQHKISLDIDSPVNPYLLSPWRDPRETRKHSLPSQQVTEGITASQVRRLSERGGEGSGPSPKEAAFLATLSQAPAPSGRRHSVVTISKVPPVLFGRSRRESVATLPNTGRILSSRRESGASVGPPSTDPLGSIHNLQLDIMDDIVQSRKARMKLWTTSNEKVCEVQVVDESGSSSAQRYTNRRFSDFITGPITPSSSFSRRASENPTIVSPCIGATASGSQKRKKTGLLGSRSDISSIFSNLTSSAIEIHKCEDTPIPSLLTPSTSRGKPSPSTSSNTLDPNVGRSTRSNSFDVSILQNAKQFITDTGDKSAAELSGWFTKRHQPMAKKKSIRSKSTAMAISKDMIEKLQSKDLRADLNRKSTKKPTKVENKGGHMDPHQIGSAIEGFLRKSTSSSSSKGAVPKDSSRKSAKSQTKPSAVKSTMNWFTKGDEDDSKDTCDSSLCSTLKDLFVK